MKNWTEKFSVKLIGEKQAIEEFLNSLDKDYIVIKTGDYLKRDSGYFGEVSIYVKVLQKQAVTQ